MQVLLPKGNAEHPTQQYPVFYTVGRCSERAPFGFAFDGCEKSESAEARAARLVRSAHEPGCEFQAAIKGSESLSDQGVRVLE